jgi:hypothetical protein
MQNLVRLLVDLLAAKPAKRLMAMLLKSDARIAALMVLLSRFPGTFRGVNSWQLIVVALNPYLLSTSE